MKICLVVSSSLDPAAPSGVEGMTGVLGSALAEAGHDVVVLASGRELVDDQFFGMPVVRVPQTERLMLITGGGAWSKAVCRELDRIRPEVAQGQGLGFAGSAVASWRMGVRVVTAHGNLLKDLRYAYSLAGWAARAPVVQWRARQVVGAADAVVNVTSDWRVNCPSKPRRMTYIPNPVDSAFFSVAPDPQAGSVAYFGGNRRIKGADILLAAWPLVLDMLPGSTLDLYGFRTHGRTSLPPSCRCHDPVESSREMAIAISRASVVVLPSRYEVSPMVAGEAMALGVPLVATDVGGVRIMTEGVASLCSATSASLATSLVDALERRGNWDSRIAEGKQRSARYSGESVALAYSALYDDLLGRRRSSRGLSLGSRRGVPRSGAS